MNTITQLTDLTIEEEFNRISKGMDALIVIPQELDLSKLFNKGNDREALKL